MTMITSPTRGATRRRWRPSCCITATPRTAGSGTPAPPLLARQYRVIRVDARGFGRSTVPAPDSYDWSLEGFAGDLRNLLDYLEIDKAHLIGETIGGTIALQFAYQYPERLHTVTTCTSPYNFTGVDTYQNYYRLVAEEGVEGWARATGGRRVSADDAPEHHEWYIQQMGQTARHVVLETLAYLGTQNLSDKLPTIQTPGPWPWSANSARATYPTGPRVRPT